MNSKPGLFTLKLALVMAVVLAAAAPALHAQLSVPAGEGDPFKDTSPLKLPADATKGVALYEFEDLECPACAHAFPLVHNAVEKYHIPLIRRDFPLQIHIWSRDAAITARYLQDKVSADAAYQFRRDVFASQTSIASKDDLAGFTSRWFTQHHLQQPFRIDPYGLFAAEVQADYRLGERIGLSHTPTLFVLTAKGWIQVVDVSQLYTTIDTALADAKPVAHNNMRKPTTPKN